MHVSITRRALYRRRRIRFMPAGERIITEHNAVSIKRIPSHRRFILNVSLRDHDEKVGRTRNEKRGKMRRVTRERGDEERREKGK